MYRGDGLNLYAYCDNNPVVYWDPSGYAKKPCDAKDVVGKFPDWKPGDSITKMTPEGKYPSWRTIRERYWMNRAKLDPNGFARQNLGRMNKGLAPQARVIVKDKKTGEIYEKLVSKEIHHANGNRGIPKFDEPINLREVWPWEHAKLLPIGRRIKSEIKTR